MKEIVMILALFALSSNVELSILSQGFTKKAPFQNAVVKNKEELKRVWNEAGITDEIPAVDFNKELVIVLVPSRKMGGSVEILELQRKANDVEVRFVVRPPTSALKAQNLQLFPYLVAKLYPLDAQKAKVKFVEDIPKPPIPADTAIGQIPSYTNVLKEYENISISQFLPIDKGNIWTYRIESNGKTTEETYSILSVSQDGWSVFDDFFGQKPIAMRIDPLGNILISSKEGMQAFYTPEVQKSFKKSEFSTPAGKFDDLMIVSVPKSDKFWFKDVYARGVGLIYHEHTSSQGTAKYTLIKAQVRGKKYPF